MFLSKCVPSACVFVVFVACAGETARARGSTATANHVCCYPQQAELCAVIQTTPCEVNGVTIDLLVPDNPFPGSSAMIVPEGGSPPGGLCFVTTGSPFECLHIVTQQGFVSNTAIVTADFTQFGDVSYELCGVDDVCTAPAPFPSNTPTTIPLAAADVPPCPTHGCDGSHCGPAVSDGCGGTQACGCPLAGNVCAAATGLCCAPQTACQTGQCGSVTDGCGSALSCACTTSGQSCVSNQCVPTLSGPTAVVVGTFGTTFVLQGAPPNAPVTFQATNRRTFVQTSNTRTNASGSALLVTPRPWAAGDQGPWTATATVGSAESTTASFTVQPFAGEVPALPGSMPIACAASLLGLGLVAARRR